MVQCIHLDDTKLDHNNAKPVVNPRSVNRHIAQSAGILMAAMLVSRVLGFFRDWTVAHQLGSSAITDAYYAAFTLPDMLSYLVAGGTLGMFFIPVFADYVAQDREDEAWHVYSTILTFMTAVFVGLILVGEIFAPQLVQLIAPGFGPHERSLVVFLTRLMLPAQLFLCLGSVMSSVQNAKMRFFVPALGSAIYNLGVVLGGWLLFGRFGIAGFAYGLLAGAFCGYFLLQVYAVRRIGGKFIPNLNLRHPGFLMFLKLGIPIMLALSSDITDDWIIRWFGSFLAPASITWLTYAKTLMRAPLVVVGAAMGAASYPFLAKLYSERKFQELNRTLNATLKGAILILIPISAMAVVLCKPVVYFVFSHTRLHPEDLHATAIALAIFSAGLFARGAQMLVSRGLYASHDTITPAIAGTSMTFLGLPLYWYFSRRWDYRGLAAASSLIAIILAVVLFVALLRRTENHGLRSLAVCFTKVSLASMAAGIICWRLQKWIEPRFVWENTHGAFAILVSVSIVGVLLILLFAKMLGVNEIEVYWKQLILRPKRSAANVPSAVPFVGATTIAADVSAAVSSELIAPTRPTRKWFAGFVRLWILPPALVCLLGAAWEIHSVRRVQLTSISVQSSREAIPQGLGVQYWAVGHYRNGTARDVTGAVEWSSSNPQVLSVDDSGLSRAVSPGTASIQIASGSLNAILNVRVTPPALVGLAVSPSDWSVAPGAATQFLLVGTRSDGQREDLTSKVGWTSTNPEVVKIASSGVATALSPGSSVIRATSGDLTTEASVVVSRTPNGFDGVYTSRYNLARTAQNRNETVLTVADVNASTFGKKFTDAVDGFVYGQPLYVPGVVLPNRGSHNVVYTATENNSVYAFDADIAGAPLWMVNLGPAVPISAQPCNDLLSPIGILGTPVIDPRTSTIYLVSRTFEDKKNYFRLHALDLATGAEKFGGPVEISATVSGSGSGGRLGRVTFDPSVQLQRPGLVLADGKVYMAFGSECDIGNFHGWVFGYDAATLAQTTVFNATANGSNGGVWQAGAAPAIDASDNLYLITGDGTFDANSGGADYGDTVDRFPLGSSTFIPRDYFAPSNQLSLFHENEDLGAGGPVLLPDQEGIHPHLLLAVGKNGTIYLLDRDSLGHFKSSTDNQIVQTIADQFQTRVHGTPSLWEGPSQTWIYLCAVDDKLKAFSLKNGVLSTSPTSQSINTFGYPGASPAVSSNGATDGIVWAISNDKNHIAILNAYDATNVARRLYGSDEAPNGRDRADKLVKFVVPTVANGKVYFGTQHSLEAYGLIR